MIGTMIGGEKVAGEPSFETENPATREVIAQVGEASEALVGKAVAAARTAATLPSSVGLFDALREPAARDLLRHTAIDDERDTLR